ncbi:MAG: fluoride efflux transporter CrcB [Balneolaceae bacterium]|nr:fluoride efflux transporter CrcB [Balneolaceae bacterium]
MKAFLLVGLGGFAGSYLRYLLSLRIQQLFPAYAFPLGTFAVNIAGSFLIGLLFGLGQRHIIGHELRMLLATGFCGGFTTFATFSMEGVLLAEQGQVPTLLLYTAASLLAGFTAAWLGWTITR